MPSSHPAASRLRRAVQAAPAKPTGWRCQGPRERAGRL